MENIDDVATCSTNRYAVEEMGEVTTLTCDQFGDYGCLSKNDDLLPMLTKQNGGCGSTTYFPTAFPSKYCIKTPWVHRYAMVLSPIESRFCSIASFPTSTTMQPSKFLNFINLCVTAHSHLILNLVLVSEANTPTELPTLSPTFEPSEYHSLCVIILRTMRF